MIAGNVPIGFACHAHRCTLNTVLQDASGNATACTRVYLIVIVLCRDSALQQRCHSQFANVACIVHIPKGSK